MSSIVYPILSVDDNSPLYRHWESGKYHADCACCWLGFSHTEQSHAQHLPDANARADWWNDPIRSGI